MSWIKRNLYFFIGSLVALILMGMAGWFLYSKWTLNTEIMGNLNSDYDELKKLNSQNPHPGSGQINNIKLAQQERDQVRDFMKKVRGSFQPIAKLPDMPKVNDHDFSVALSRTIAELQRDATNSSVTLPANYSFSFEAQKARISFASNSLDRLSVQLGEVRTIAEALFRAKVNSLDNLRRERVSPDDSSGPQTDYLIEKSITNELAILTPYEVTFRCFSSELASVLSDLAAESCGVIIKTLNVDVAPAPPPQEPSTSPAMNPMAYVQQPAQSALSAEQEDAIARANAAAAFARRYGMRGGGAENLGGIALREGFPARPAYALPMLPAAAQPAKGGLPTVLDEKQLKLTVNLLLVKLLPPK